jgi:hypothetical protein
MKEPTRISCVVLVFGAIAIALVGCGRHSELSSASKPGSGVAGSRDQQAAPLNTSIPAPHAVASSAVDNFPSSFKVANLKLHGQETEDWCWAASAQSIMESLGATRDVRQCVQAQNLFANGGRPNCCKDPVDTRCAQPAWPEFGSYGFSVSLTKDGAALSWDEVRIQTAKKKKPFAFTWNWSEGGAHMMVAYGYEIRGGVQSVNIFNPLPLSKGYTDTIPYDVYVDLPGDHYHSRDYYDVSPNIDTTEVPAGSPSKSNLNLIVNARKVIDSREGGTIISSAATSAAKKTAESAVAKPSRRPIRHSPLVFHQSDLMRLQLREAEPVIKDGLQKYLPDDFRMLAPGGAKFSNVGAATPALNIGVNELHPSVGNKIDTQPALRELVQSIRDRLSGDPSNLYIPVRGPDSKRGALTLIKSAGQWKWVSFQENSPISNALTMTNIYSSQSSKALKPKFPLGVAEDSSPPPGRGSRNVTGVVNVRSLNLSFLAIEDARGLQFSPLWTAPKYGFKEGVSVPADQAIKVMQEKGPPSQLPR